MRQPVIMMLAGEASGDLHGSRVARALREQWPGASLFGLGGEKMASEGVELLAGLDRLAVMGFVEVARHLPYFLRLEAELGRALSERGVDLVLPIDYPGLNLRVARRAREIGVPVLYYIAPQVWAWKPRRAHRLARDTERVAVILPFEEKLLRAAGARAVFVGHPLLEAPPVRLTREAFARRHGLDPGRPILGLFPGSRAQEIRKHWRLFLATGRRLVERHPEVQLAVARAASVEHQALSGGGVAVVDDGAALLHYARAALIKSGTTTLEAAIAGTPFVTVYRTHPVTYALARRLVRVPHVALANLVAGRRVVPEVLQDEATPDRLEGLLAPLLDSESTQRTEMLRALAAVRDALGSPGASKRVARLAAEILGDSGDESSPPSEA